MSEPKPIGEYKGLKVYDAAPAGGTILCTMLAEGFGFVVLVESNKPDESFVLVKPRVV